MATSSNSDSLYFLSGGGEMGQLIRETDWSKTPLGDPENWPHSLRTAVGIILNNPFGMYIAWGENYIQLYNDGYRPILGANKHPQALGISTRETFSEIWHIIGDMFDGVMQGKGVGFTDFMLPLNRNGFVEECYFDFSYSPILKSNGKVGGVLVTVIETTNKKKAQDALKESEKRFRAMADNIPNLAWMADSEGGIFWYNKQWYEFTGTTPEQMKGWGWQSVHHPDTLQSVLTKWQESIATGKSFEMVFPLRNAGGQFRQFLTRVLPVFDSQGKIYQWFGSNTDITERIETEQKLKASEAQFKMLSETIPHMVWTATPDGNKNFFNQYFLDYTGFSFEALTGSGWQKIIFPDDLERELTQWHDTLLTGKEFIIEKRILHYDGTYRWHLCHSIPQKDLHGNITGWIGTNTDIHEQKTKEQLKDDFISIASHEMKTPLTTAKAYIELLMISLGTENKAVLYATKANQAVERLHNLIIELLDSSKIQNGKLNYNLSTFDFNKMADETIENFQHGTKKHSLQKTGTCSQPITGDKERLQQVLINLLSNAVKYSPKANKVLVKIEEKDGQIQFSVQDFGIGMPRHHLDKIFDRYYRVQEHAINFQGLGIGLYISNNIIQRHNGKMWADSEPDKGSTFYFSLPL